MNSESLTFDLLHPLVTSLDQLETQLQEFLSRIGSVLVVLRTYFQDHVCDHRHATTWRDYSDPHRSTNRTTCKDCDKWIVGGR
jgi:hypothetical protein